MIAVTPTVVPHTQPAQAPMAPQEKKVMSAAMKALKGVSQEALAYHSRQHLLKANRLDGLLEIIREGCAENVEPDWETDEVKNSKDPSLKLQTLIMDFYNERARLRMAIKNNDFDSSELKEYLRDQGYSLEKLQAQCEEDGRSLADALAQNCIRDGDTEVWSMLPDDLVQDYKVKLQTDYKIERAFSAFLAEAAITKN
ncbi:MAG: hypothetical protein COT85_02460 [Chlamydiae bacterium CG10_big_fil_rev_8_21_14_0_10_42_34]|nr:MAG: hypothetical protein COT85_02460 [Chlamydiae bacterium CG10_big_fil_rev_8_21_14_0_10_42_34]